MTPYRVQAHNSAQQSENRIHDDSVARRFGFAGGLVPGVDVYAYMAHPAVQHWGRAWLERGSMTCRFIKPVYHGEVADIAATPGAGGLDIQVHSLGEHCAGGQAALPSATPGAGTGDFVRSTPPETRPPADAQSLAPGTPLCTRTLDVTADFAAQYLSDVRETDPLYAREKLVHPGMILRHGNWALTHNVVLGPWIHVGSTVTHLSAAHVGDSLQARARVTANYQRKGHMFVELDMLVLANDTAVARIAHTAIYRPRERA